MSKEEILLQFFVDKLSNIKEILNDTKDIENFLIQLQRNKKLGVDEVLEKTKKLVDSLCDHSIKIKEEFYKQYNLLESAITEKGNLNDEISGVHSEQENACNSDNLTNKENLNNVEHESRLHKECATEICTEEHTPSIVENSADKSEDEDRGALTEEENNLPNLQDPLADPGSPDIIDSSILDNKNEHGIDHEKQSPIDNITCDKNMQEHKSLIRLVDLNKLIDPKEKKSVKFDNSIIILTSSDEETSPTKKNRTKHENGKLKSALKNVEYNSADNKVKKRMKDQSKSEHSYKSKGRSFTDKTFSKKKHKSGTQESDGENEIIQISQKENKDDEFNKSSPELSSDSDIQEIHLEKGADKDILENNKSTNESNSDSSDKNSIDDNDEIRKCNSKSKSEDSSENESISSLTDKEKTSETVEENLRKSSRIKAVQLSKQNERILLRKMCNRKLRRSENSDFQKQKKIEVKGSNDSESDVSTKKPPFKQKNDLVQTYLSDTSSLSDSDTNFEIGTVKNKTKKNKSTKITEVMPIDINDEKFRYEVYIPLPRINCMQLKETFLKNKEIFEIKRLTKLNLPKRKKAYCETRNDNPKSSSDSEKPKSKKSKSSTPKKKSSSEDEDSDDESLGKLTSSDKENSEDGLNKDEKLTENASNKDEHMADIATDKFNESDTEKSDSSKSELETNIKEQKTKETNKNEEVVVDDINNEEKSGSASGSNSGIIKKNWRKDKLLALRIYSSDSEDESEKDTVDKTKNQCARKVRKRVRKPVVESDSDESNNDKTKNSDNSYDSKGSDTSDDKKSNSDSEDMNKKKPARKRIKRTKDSSSSEDDKTTRKNIRRVIGRDSLSETTKQAEDEEKQRKARIAEKQKKYNKLFEETTESKVDKVVLDYDEKEKKEILGVHKGIVKKLKPHQASGIQFMWDACFESLERTKNTKGSGCILAHCMGLGKTLQVIALAHTLLTNDELTGVHKIMVVCPLNTVLNWKSEFKKWLPKGEPFEVYELVSCKQNHEREFNVSEWHTDGGVLIIGYNMFRNLSNPDNKRLTKKMRKTFAEGLVDPGPDLVICDEGHLLKNEKTHLSIAMNRIKTLRRIVLTGTPLQNNLKEYWCMVQFIKPNLLGTYKEYLNRFVNPITNGQYTDSTQRDILVMRKRSHVLHKLLDGVVQRRDYAVLEPYLPPKYEYVLFIKLTDTQVKLYKHYMEKFARQSDGSNRTSFLFADFQELQRICTHPRVLLDRSKERREKDSLEDEESEGSLKDFIDDNDQSSEESGSSSSQSNSDSECSEKEKKSKRKQQKTRVTRAQAAQRRENNEESDPEVEEIKKEWFQEYCDGEELDNINNSGKLFLLFQILKECEEIGDKILVFSQSLLTLNCIEYFLEKIDEATQKGDTEKVGGHSGSWAIGLDYFRLDGSSSCDNRATWCNMFNNPDNTRARLFLISTRAGGLGINLVAANRVIIYDVSWNPSHDIQSIYRVYRFGQTKPCYVYRFVAYGTMEMKIYERQVTKQAISKRVIDEQQIDRHYNQNDLQELYRCDLEPTDRPIPMVPKDVLLGEMLQKYENTIYKYHLHQSLLENKTDEVLNEEERKAAWEEFENEKVLRQNTGFALSGNARVNAQAIETALANIVRKDNPTWSEIQIRGIIPALVQQLQVQLSEGDTTMYNRVQHEIQEMQAQKLREAYYQQQVMRMIQKQQQQAKMIGNLNVDPFQLARMQDSNINNMIYGNMNQGGPSRAPPSLSNDVIELND